MIPKAKCDALWVSDDVVVVVSIGSTSGRGGRSAGDIGIEHGRRALYAQPLDGLLLTKWPPKL